MTNCHNCDDCCSRQNCEVIEPVSPPHESKLVKVQDVATLEVPMDFFNDFKLKGSIFKLQTLNLNKQKIAVKWVHQSHTCSFGKHIETLQHAAEITAAVITSFMKRTDTEGWDINVVMPLQSTNENLEIGIEPFIQNTKQFNSNSFWECDTPEPYHRLIVALAHFSYAASEGKYVLTNLHGGVDEEHKIVTLLAPILVSEKQAKYGCMDVGEVKGFFARHTCNSFCYDIPRREGESKDGSRFRVTQI